MSDSHRPSATPDVLPYATPVRAGQQSVRPSALLFAMTFYALSVGMTLAGEAALRLPTGEYGAAADAMIVAILMAPFALLALLTFAVTARAVTCKATFPAVAALEGAACGIVMGILVATGNAMRDRAIAEIALVIFGVAAPIIAALIIGRLSRRAIAKEKLT